MLGSEAYPLHNPVPAALHYIRPVSGQLRALLLETLGSPGHLGLPPDPHGVTGVEARIRMLKMADKYLSLILFLTVSLEGGQRVWRSLSVLAR